MKFNSNSIFMSDFDYRDHGNSIELFVYLVLTLFSLSLVYLLCYSWPRYYVYLVQEDNFGEYATSVAYGLSAIGFVNLAFKSKKFLHRSIFAVGGIFALFLSGEEISWGQRILGVATPEFLSRINLQNEITLHNIYFLHELNDEILPIVVSIWFIFSIAARPLLPRIRNSNITLRNLYDDLSIFMMPISLSPLFILPLFFFLFFPIVTPTELYEFFVAVAVFMWSIILSYQYGEQSPVRGRSAVFKITSALMILVFLSVLLSLIPLQFQLSKSRLEKFPTKHFPEVGLYQQADELFRYIYEYPKHLGPMTRLEHARMLLDIGQVDEATSVLTAAVDDLESRIEVADVDSKNFRILGLAYLLLKQDSAADKAFNDAIEMDKQALLRASSPVEIAARQWSIARTLYSWGRYEDSQEAFRKAQNYGIAQIEMELERWNDCVVQNRFRCSPATWPEVILRQRW